VQAHGAKMVALSGEDVRFTWNQLELFMKNWSRIDQLVDEPGPCIYLLGGSGLRPVNRES